MELQKSKVHFIGVGGIGMSGLAELFFNLGAQVSGSDLQTNIQTQYLSQLGLSIFKGHEESNLGEADVVVYSSAIPQKNPEYIKAKKNKIPCIPRAEALAEIMRLKKGIAIAGTHGKTTTTSLTASIFLEAQSDPTIVVGGRLDLIQSTAKLGKGDWLIAEADESDGSFLKLNPLMGVITNIDKDHMDFYKDFYEIQKSFLNFSEQIPFYGSMIVYGDDPATKNLFKDYSKKIIFYGFQESNDFVLKEKNQSYEIYNHHQFIGVFTPSMPGSHNALNSLASIIVGLEAGFSFDVCKKGIESFTGVERRFQHKGRFKNVEIYDDYGHHPTEVKAVLQSFKEKFSEQKLLVLFEPHRYSRTKACWDEFITCFEGVDALILMDTYRAGENPIVGAESRDLFEKIKDTLNMNIEYLPISSYEYHDPKNVKELNSDAFQHIKERVEQNDLFLTLGAGKVYKIGEALLEE